MAAKKTAGELYQELVTLRDRSGESLYLRIQLASQLLADKTWVGLPEGGGGDESKALDRLEDTAFGDVCGAVSLPEMLELMRRIPEKSTWKVNRYNLRKMHAEMRARDEVRRPQRPPAPPSGNTRPSTPEEQVRKLREEVQAVRAAAAEVKAESRTENRQLKEENRKLKTAVRNLQVALAALQQLQPA